LCTNAQIRISNKIFVQVPADEKRKKLWFKVAHRSDESIKSRYYCCENHFNVSTK